VALAWVLLIVAITPALAYWAADPQGWRRQSDFTLCARSFTSIGAAFETLAEMACQGSVIIYSLWQDNLDRAASARAAQTINSEACVLNWGQFPLCRAGRLEPNSHSLWRDPFDGAEWSAGMSIWPITLPP